MTNLIETSFPQTLDEIILEIRSGTGGEEAALFARNLAEMYHKYAEKKGWKIELLDESRTDIGGYKYVSFSIRGQGILALFKSESGVHRVQRIPTTEKSGRIHTSTASVAVLKEPTESEIIIRPQDLEIGFFRSSGPGGQNVNKVETGVRISHRPTGLVVESQVSRSQQKNREAALKLLRARILDQERTKAQSEMANLRRKQIGSADRAEKIRTYNFPQDRITDHRIKKSWNNIQSILNGNLDAVINSLAKTKINEW